MTSHKRWDAARAAVWTLIGAGVVLAVFFLVMAGVGPGEATVACIVLAVLGVLWVVHAWPRFTTRDSTHINHADRERRGF